MSDAVFGYIPRSPFLDEALQTAHDSLQAKQGPVPGCSGDSGRQDRTSATLGSRDHCGAVTDKVRRNNLAVQLANGKISHWARFAEVQPKMRYDGNLPIQFQSPKTVDEIRSLDWEALELILKAYRLPVQHPSASPLPENEQAIRNARSANLCVLFDYLGASRVSDYERYPKGSGAF